MNAPGSNGPEVTDYIDHAMMEAALKRHLSCGTITVESIAVEPANKAGAGYGSQMSRVRVAFRKGEEEATQQLPLVVKADVITAEERQKGEVKWDIFKLEALVLAEVIPTAHEALRRVEGASFRPLAATCLHHGAKPRGFLVLDDLVAAGYRLADDGRLLDYQHCELVMRAYARLHAGTAHVLSKSPDYGTQLNMDFFSGDGMQFILRPMMQCNFSAVADFVKKVPGYERYADKFAGLADTLLPLMTEALKKKVQDTKLKVLVHGDSWKNNMMFKYSVGEVADVRLVDFQLVHVSSPARDLVYFLSANAGVDVHERLPSLLETYHSQLQASLRALGMAAAADAYPLDELLRDMEDLNPFALYTSTFCGVVVSSEHIGEKYQRALRELNFQPDTLYGIYDNEHCRAYIQYTIRHFESKGLL
ncbi:uncharacterized protein LOC126456426 [Schistocerca serialis cubense]|uniref:uncharacterized protein LOC126456426 n=1 Tax=Schistocerca serialis cubense TaxID=2023355 RepID=UPI00214EF989|nr:uncharacterized protein LOC126456426 [Schistocerca serialis cubense]